MRKQNNEEEIVSRCHQCGKKWDGYVNCRNRRCNLLFLQCPECQTKYLGTCGNDVCIQVEKSVLLKGAKTGVERTGIARTWPIIRDGYRARVRPKQVLTNLNH